ncbi:MAG: AAA family ATPase [Candidatus Helarchaeota archaeon]
MKIKAINIYCFRGIPELELELNKKSLLIKGENGSGKSSIIDAFEFFFTGKISHLEGTKSLSLKRHGPHINFNHKDIKVEMVFEDNTRLWRTFKKEPTPPPVLNSYFEETEKGTFILRRSQLLEFIISQPSERFRAIGSIMGIEFLDNIELQMKRARDDLEGEFKSKRQTLKRLYEEISKLLGKNVSEIRQFLPIINLKLRNNGLKELKNLKDLDKYCKNLFNRIKIKAEKSDEVEKFQRILRVINTLNLEDEDLATIKKINNIIKTLIEDDNRRKLSYIELYNVGIAILKDESIKFCPLCEQPINRNNLSIKIHKRLQELRDLSDQASTIRTESIPIINLFENLIKKLEILFNDLENISGLSNERSMIKNILYKLSKITKQIDSAKELKNEINLDEILKIKNNLDKIINKIQNKIQLILEKIELSKEERKLLDIYNLLNALKNKHLEILNILKEIRLAEVDYNTAQLIYTNYSQVKKEKIQNIYNLIQSDARRFYETIHPNDPHQNITLEISTGKRASTELKIDSFGRESEDPRAFTSEGHLDSLGLCIFLSFVKKFNINCPLIILDDIITTIDAQHREKIATLLLTEFQQYQLIIATHDGIWYEQLRAAQRILGIENNFINLEIISWNKDSGPHIRKYKPRWERIIEKIDNGDKSGAGNDGRSYLEWLLKKLCGLMRVQVEFKEDGRYTMAELLDPAEKRIKEKSQGEFKNKVENAFNELRMKTLLANILSHDNLLIESVSIQEVKEFCHSIYNLHKLFLCPNCKNFLKYSREAHKIKCSNERCSKPYCFET